MSQPSWLSKPLGEMSPTEWESICDGCAKCCLHKLEDDDTGEIFHTNVACQLLDENSCQCSDYDNRFSKVPDCFKLTPQNLEQQSWLPSSCAYRVLYEGKQLPLWHPLISGDSKSIHASGMSVRGKVVTEQAVRPEDMEEYIISWVN
ncbi:MAG: YcgN family cysteine cluster protein [Porticoccus sp.]|nr:YcgN family cysteine cluster protein [Porticoccus sp.]